jgi:hypothetical protein
LERQPGEGSGSARFSQEASARQLICRHMEENALRYKERTCLADGRLASPPASSVAERLIGLPIGNRTRPRETADDNQTIGRTDVRRIWRLTNAPR